MVKPWVILLLVGSGVAEAGPTTRFGLTGAFADQSAPDAAQLGPLFAVGERFGSFVGEIDYAYLSFFGANIDHRLGVTLRADLSRTYSGICTLPYACTRGTTFFGEAGIAERFGHLSVDAQHPDPIAKNEPEAHIGLGIELENQLEPYRNGWQFGLRFAMTPSQAAVATACRGSGCPTTSSRAVDTAVLFEWMYVLGR
ncbi:MAG: hypothetical protein JWO36_844 [Myxococcales bacterium]|nr:hypothetical protein [Myxococcales bacterium]